MNKILKFLITILIFILITFIIIFIAYSVHNSYQARLYEGTAIILFYSTMPNIINYAIDIIKQY